MFSIVQHLFLPIDRALPTWLASSKIQWLCWAYALWQLVRTNTVVLLIISVIPYNLIRLIARKKSHLVGLARIPSPLGSTEPKCPYAENNEDEEEKFWNVTHRPQTFEVVPREQRQTWPSSWRAVKYKGYYYFTSQRALQHMAAWMHECDYQEHSVIFGKWREWSVVGEYLSRDEAYRKMLSGDYAVDVQEMHWWIMPTWMKYVEVSRVWWGVLSLIPTLMQVWSLNRLATTLTSVVIILDYNRAALHTLYQYLFLHFRIFVKSRVFKDKRIFYFVSGSLFSKRWFPTTREPDQLASATATVENMKLYNFCRLKNLEDVHFNGGGQYSYGEYNASSEYVIFIDGENASVLPRETIKPFTYANATLTTAIFVE